MRSDASHSAFLCPVTDAHKQQGTDLLTLSIHCPLPGVLPFPVNLLSLPYSYLLSCNRAFRSQPACIHLDPYVPLHNLPTTSQQQPVPTGSRPGRPRYPYTGSCISQPPTTPNAGHTVTRPLLQQVTTQPTNLVHTVQSHRHGFYVDGSQVRTYLLYLSRCLKAQVYSLQRNTNETSAHLPCPTHLHNKRL